MFENVNTLLFRELNGFKRGEEKKTPTLTNAIQFTYKSIFLHNRSKLRGCNVVKEQKNLFSFTTNF